MSKLSFFLYHTCSVQNLSTNRDLLPITNTTNPIAPFCILFQSGFIDRIEFFMRIVSKSKSDRKLLPSLRSWPVTSQQVDNPLRPLHGISRLIESPIEVPISRANSC